MIGRDPIMDGAERGDAAALLISAQVDQSDRNPLRRSANKDMTWRADRLDCDCVDGGERGAGGEGGASGEFG